MNNAFASGDLWIAYAWPNDWVTMKAKGLKVQYMHPREGPLSWVGMLMLGKGSPRPQHAHAYADAWSSVQSASWLENNYGYGAANLKARPKSSDLLRVLEAHRPERRSRAECAHRPYVPRRAVYARLWQQVKAA